MRLTRPALFGLLAAALALCVLVSPEAALAKSSLGIGTAEVTAQPSGPFAGLFIEINAVQRAFFTSLREALVALRSGPHGFVFLVAVSFAYGIFHAAGPGHGKAVISSYVLANEVQLRRGIALSFVSALLQALTALVVVGIGWFLLRGTSIKMTDATNWLEIVSFALIVAFGAWLLLRKLAAVVRRRLPHGAFRVAAARAVSARSMSAGSMSAGSVSAGSGPAGLAFAASGTAGGTAAAAPRVLSGPTMRPASGSLSAAVCNDDDCDCGRAHMPDPARLGEKRLSLGSAASAVFAVGLRPCSGAIVVLTFGLLNGLYLGGVLSVFAMALGTAITVSAIAALAVFAKGFALRLGRAGGIPRGVTDVVEIAGAALVLLLGLALLGGALA